MKNSEPIKRRRIDPKGFPSAIPDPEKPEKVETPGIDPAAFAYDNLHWTTKAKIMLKQDGKIRRFLTGKNKAGRIFHSILDVLPIPNVHEVIKRIIKENEQAGRAISAVQVIRDTLKRLDWIRTIGALAVAVILIRAADWTGVDLDILFDLLKRVSELL